MVSVIAILRHWLWNIFENIPRQQTNHLSCNTAETVTKLFIFPWNRVIRSHYVGLRNPLGNPVLKFLSMESTLFKVLLNFHKCDKNSLCEFWVAFASLSVLLMTFISFKKLDHNKCIQSLYSNNLTVQVSHSSGKSLLTSSKVPYRQDALQSFKIRSSRVALEPL